jgi:hypothetical protein
MDKSWMFVCHLGNLIWIIVKDRSACLGVIMQFVYRVDKFISLLLEYANQVWIQHACIAQYFFWRVAYSVLNALLGFFWITDLALLWTWFILWFGFIFIALFWLYALLPIWVSYKVEYWLSSYVKYPCMQISCVYMSVMLVILQV